MDRVRVYPVTPPTIHKVPMTKAGMADYSRVAVINPVWERLNDDGDAPLLSQELSVVL